MNKLILIAGLCLSVSSLVSCYRLVCYSTNWSQDRSGLGKFTPSDIDPDLCTHLIYAYSGISPTSELVPTRQTDTEHYASFNGLKTRNPNLKTLLAVRPFGVLNIFILIQTRVHRDRFILSTIKVLRDSGFDGLDLHWENHNAWWRWDRHPFTALCKELLEAFEAEGIATGRPRLLISAAVEVENGINDRRPEPAELAKYLDFINVKTYDFAGWSTVGRHHSPLRRGSHDTGKHSFLNIVSVMSNLLMKGVPEEKLNMGFAAYGRTYRAGSEPAPTGGRTPGPFTKIHGILSYYEICSILNETTVGWIEDQKVPYFTRLGEWVGFDNKQSLEAKVDYLKRNRFGGAFVWSLDLDDFTGQFCGEGNYTFIKHLRSLLRSELPPLAATLPPVTPAMGGEQPETTPTDWGQPKTTPQPTPTDVKQPRATPSSITIRPTADVPGDNFCAGKAEDLYVKPDDPGSFYNCANNITWVLHCPATLLYRDACKCCDWP